MEPDRRIRRIAIVGGGVAGWLAAVALGRKLGGHCSIHVVEAPETVIPGQAEATLPAVLDLLRFLGLDQNDFIDKTQSTYSLGTKFVDWAAPGESFWHPFGALGALIERRPFYHFWHKSKAIGLKPKLELFSQEISLGVANRFIFPTNSLGVAPHLRYALHVDVALMARYFRSIAERAGAIRLERNVVSATRRDDGFIDELQFEDGGKLGADLFLDCTGARGQLIGEILEIPYESWQQWLPCDRVVHAAATLEDARAPYVRNSARASGWQWRIPLQQNLSHGQVYSSAHQNDEDALQELLATIGSEPLTEPRRQEFTAGRRVKFWDKNVVSIGFAAGAVESLGATDLHLLTNAVFNLLDHFPDKQFDPTNIASYNALIAEECERIRDFIILHYCASRRDDSPFWQERQKLALPDTLAQRIEMYRATGRIMQQRLELFTDLDWFWIFEGMGITPRDYDPLVDTVDFEQVKRLMLAISQKVSADAAAAPTHDSFFAVANAKVAGARKAAAVAQSAG
ncbi:MAG TPA: tryptophan halogenase family protein [Steroidobacteraceae bacterium]|jgi:tryptophan halogenase|nr:tryptophan halogenase family protein [Steroidobacteraceae bacterium]